MRLVFFVLLVLCSVLFFQEKAYSQCPAVPAVNLVVNGNFEGPVDATYSGYTYKSGVVSGEGNWGIGTGMPNAIGNSYRPPTDVPFGNPMDHSPGTQAGRFMLIDAKGSAVDAWRSKPIAVTIGVTYYFSAWIANINTKNVNPPRLQFSVGGTIISPTIITTPGQGPTATASDADHSWQQFYATYVAPATTSVIISMVNTNPDDQGNDLALDDITFSTSCEFVNQLALSELPRKIYLCDGSNPVLLDSRITDPSISFTWFNNGSVIGSSSTFITPAGLTNYPSGSLGQYILCYTNGACTRQDTVDVVNQPLVVNVTPVSPATCGPNGTIKIGDLAPGAPYQVDYTFGGSPVTLTNQIPDAQGKINISVSVGTYSNIVVSALGCSSVSQTVNLANPPSPVITVVIDEVPDHCSDVGTLIIKGTSGVADKDLFTVTYNNGVNVSLPNQEADGVEIELKDIPAGTYNNIAITDKNNCKSNEINQPLLPNPAITATVTQPSCPTLNAKIRLSNGSGSKFIKSGIAYEINFKLDGVQQTTLTITPSSSNIDLLNVAGGSYTDIQINQVGNTTCLSSLITATVNQCCPLPNAGADQTICTTLPRSVTLTGTISTGTPAAAIDTWVTSGSGSFGGATSLNTTYTPSSADSAAGTVTLTLKLQSNGTCGVKTDAIIVTLKTNLSNAGVSQSKCSNNASTVLAGSVSRFPTSVTGPTGGIWSGGAGTYSGSGATNLTSTYTPTVGEISSGSVILTLTTTGGTCAGGVDTMKITFTNPPTANANISQTICASTGVVTLNGSVTIASGGTWTRYVGGTTTGLASPSVLNTTFTPTNAELSSGGSIILTLTTTGNGGCTAVSDTMKVNIDKAPTANAGIDQSVCATTVNTASVSLSGTAFPSINTWTSTGTGTFGNATTLTTSYTPTVADTTAHSIKLILSTQSNGLCAATKDTTIISFNPTPLVNANTSQTKCANIVNTAGVTLNGTVYNATGGTWARYPSLITTGITSPTSLNSTFTPSAADTASRKVTLVLTSTGNGGCASITDTMTIFFDIVPIAKAGSDKTVCTSTPTFAVNGAAYPGIGTWSKSGTGTFGNATALSTTYTPSSADNLLSTYTLTLTSLPNGTCLAVSDQLIVTVVAPPNPNLAVSDAKICEGSNGTLIITGSEAGKGYQAFDALSGTSMSAVDTSTGGNLSLTIPATNLPYDGTNNPTPYNIVIAVYGCDTTALVDQSTIEVTPVPLANAGTDIQVDDYIPIHLDGSGSSQGAGYTYQWTSSDPSSSTIANPISDTTTVDVQSISLSFTLTVTDVVNTTCKASDVVNIKVQPKPVVIPNAFSPNGDGTHDTFVIQNIKFFKNAVLYIYNQWGELIYKSDPGYKIPWDGTRNGKDVPVSAYYYVLELNLTGFNSLSGDITIIK